MSLNDRTNPLTLIADAIPHWDRKNETSLTSLVTAALLNEPAQYVWCSRSKNGKSWEHRLNRRTRNSYTGVRTVDLAYGQRTDVPSVLVQVKYDEGMRQVNPNDPRRVCTNTPRNHALRDMLYLSLELDRMGEGVECDLMSVVHEDNLKESHRWLPFLQEGGWTLRCEPSAINRIGRHSKDLIDPERRIVQPYTVGQVNEMFGTKWQRAGYGLFARPGVLEVRFRTQSQRVEEFAVIDWKILSVSLAGTEMPLAAWLP